MSPIQIQRGLRVVRQTPVALAVIVAQFSAIQHNSPIYLQLSKPIKCVSCPVAPFKHDDGLNIRIEFLEQKHLLRVNREFDIVSIGRASWKWASGPNLWFKIVIANSMMGGVKGRASCSPESASTKNNDVAVGSTSAGNNTSARSLFDVSTTTSTPFGTCTANNDAAVSGAPGTAFPAFTPMSEGGGSYETICFQNILSMDAYREWSSEELRLADYSQGHKQGPT
ncbi:hypothetical protein V8F06_014550 [Rhypophila decipiens]